MKYLFVIILAIGYAISSHAQEYDGVVVTERSMSSDVGDDALLYKPKYKQIQEWKMYTKKYNKLRTVGWGLMGAGIPASVGGFFLMATTPDNKYGLTTAGIVLLSTGLGSMGASIPILISAYHYRHKAKMMDVSLSAIPTPRVGGSMAYNYAPALSVAITF